MKLITNNPRRAFLALGLFALSSHMLSAATDFLSRGMSRGRHRVSGKLVLAKYKANRSQISQAQRKGASVYIRQGVTPAYVKKKQQIISQSSKPAAKKEMATDLAALNAALQIAKAEAAGKAVAIPNLANVSKQEIKREASALLATASRSVPNLAVPVSEAGNPAEANNAVSVMTYHTGSNPGVKDDTVYVLSQRPASGVQINVGGSAQYQNL